MLLLGIAGCMSLQAQVKPAGAAAKDTMRTLDSVKVSARKPLVTRRADRYIVNVENSFLATGHSALDVLQKSPGLWVTPNGSIRITGSQSVTVMINDIVQRMSELELAEYLKTLRSEDISKIEVIPNPPAEYEAASSGGIVHIILKRTRRQGLTGSVFAQYKQQGSKPYASAGASLDYKLKKFYLFGNYNYTRDNSRYTGFTATAYPDQSSIVNQGERNNNNTRSQYRVGVVYDLSAVQSINIQQAGTRNDLLQQFHSAIEYKQPGSLVTGDAHTDWIRHPRFSSTTLTYSWNIDTIGTALKIIGDYSSSSKRESNTLTSVYSNPAMSATYRTNTPSTTGMYSGQADYTKAFARKTIVRTGLKYVRTNRHNTIVAEDETGGSWVKDPSGSNDFQYNEDLLMGYGSFEKLIGRTSVKAGLRGEQTYSKGISLTSGETIRRDYFGWFPSLFIDHTLEEKKGNSVHLNYSRRVRRPAYNDLNPYRLQVNDYAILTGNPNLQPQYTHSIQAGYTWHREFMADLYLKATSDFIAQTARTIDDRIIEHMSKNYPRNTEFGLSLSVPVTIVKGWRTNNGLTLYHAESDLNDVKISRSSLYLKTVHTIEWKKVVDFDFYAEYNSPYTSANSRMAELFFADLGITKSIWKNKGRIRLSFTDLFNTFREKELTEYDNTRIDFYQKRPTRTASVSFSWNFSAGKAFTRKKIDPNNTDEKSRMGN
jgi:hypothetical protein